MKQFQWRKQRHLDPNNLHLATLVHRNSSRSSEAARLRKPMASMSPNSSLVLWSMEARGRQPCFCDPFTGCNAMYTYDRTYVYHLVMWPKGNPTWKLYKRLISSELAAREKFGGDFQKENTKSIDFVLVDSFWALIFYLQPCYVRLYYQAAFQPTLAALKLHSTEARSLSDGSMGKKSNCWNHSIDSEKGPFFLRNTDFTNKAQRYTDIPCQ